MIIKDELIQPDEIGNEDKKKEKEIARMEKEEAKMERDVTKRQYNLERLRIALERLQLNWIKFNITCIALGFTTYKFYYSRSEEEKSHIHYITGREIGIFLISLGLLMLILATFQHKKNVAKLKLQYETMPGSLSLLLSYFTMFFSVIILLLVVLRT